MTFNMLSLKKIILSFQIPILTIPGKQINVRNRAQSQNTTNFLTHVSAFGLKPTLSLNAVSVTLLL